MAYDLAFLRLEENHFLSIPVERVRQLPAQMQRLLGWSASSTLLGWVEIDGQMRDPQELLGMPSFPRQGRGSSGTAMDRPMRGTMSGNPGVM